jgi:hypothetical protein
MLLDANLKSIDFSILQPGDKFFMSRPEAVGGGRPYAKTATTKNVQGKWVNAKDSIGITLFVPYDTKVWLKI